MLKNLGNLKNPDSPKRFGRNFFRDAPKSLSGFENFRLPRKIIKVGKYAFLPRTLGHSGKIRVRVKIYAVWRAPLPAIKSLLQQANHSHSKFCQVLTPGKDLKGGHSGNEGAPEEPCLRSLHMTARALEKEIPEIYIFSRNSVHPFVSLFIHQ